MISRGSFQPQLFCDSIGGISRILPVFSSDVFNDANRIVMLFTVYSSSNVQLHFIFNIDSVVMFLHILL